MKFVWNECWFSARDVRYFVLKLSLFLFFSLPILNPFVFQIRNPIFNHSSLHRLFIRFRHFRIRRTPINLNTHHTH